MEKVQWKVEGMTCSNCALTINQYLQKEGVKNISVSPIDGDVSFRLNGVTTKQKIANGIASLGYTIAPTDSSVIQKETVLIK